MDSAAEAIGIGAVALAAIGGTVAVVKGTLAKRNGNQKKSAGEGALCEKHTLILQNHGERLAEIKPMLESLRESQNRLHVKAEGTQQKIIDALNAIKDQIGA